MRGFGLQRRLAVGVASVAFLLVAGVPASQAKPCYDPYFDALRVDGRCGAPSAKDRQLQVIDPAGKRLRANGSFWKMT